MKVSLQSFYLIVFSSQCFVSFADISNLRKCADQNCAVKISSGRTTVRYSPREKGVLGFRIDEVVDIYSKEAGTNPNLWGVVIAANPPRSGFVPKKFITEEKIFVKDESLTFIVPMKLKDEEGNKKIKAEIHSTSQLKSHVDSKNTISSNEVFVSASDLEYSNLKENIGKVVEENIVLEHDAAFEFDSSSFPGNKTLSENAQEILINPTNLHAGIKEASENNDIDSNLPMEFLNSDIKLPIPDISSANIKIDNNFNPENSLGDIKINNDFNPKNSIGESKVSHELDNKVSQRMAYEDQSQFHANIKTREILSKEESEIREVKINIDQDEYEASKIEIVQVNEYLNDNIESSINNGPKSDDSKTTDEITDEAIKNSDIDDGDDDDEEMDNEDEGNGNEGEENGNEMNIDSVIKRSSNSRFEDIQLKNDPDIIELLTPTSEDKETKNDANSEDSSFSGSEDIEPKDSKISATLPVEFSSSHEAEQLYNTGNNSNSFSLPVPTPSSNYEVFEGTTLYLDDANVNSDNSVRSSEPSGLNKPPSFLEASQAVDEKQDTQATPQYIHTTESSQFSNNIDSKPAENEENTNSHIDEITTPVSESVQSLDMGSDNLKSSLDMPIPSDKVQSIIEDGDSVNLLNTAENSESKPVESGFIEEIKIPLGTSDSVEIIDTSVTEPPQIEVFVPPKLESILDKSEISSDNLKEESEGKSFFSSFFHNTLERFQDVSKESIMPGDEAHESVGDASEFCHAEKCNSKKDLETDSVNIELPFSDPYKEALIKPNEDTSTNPTFPFDKPAQHISPMEKDDNSEAKTVHKVNSPSENILDASRSMVSENFLMAIEGELAHSHLSFGSSIVLVIIAVTIITLYIIHVIYVKFSRESPLLEAMNQLDKEQRFIIEENNNLKRMLTTSSNGQIKSTISSVHDHIEFSRLQDELTATKSNLEMELEQLKQHNIQLERDLEVSTANEEELNRMISELLFSQNETKSFEDSVNFLQTTLDDQREKVESLTSDLAHKTRLNDELRTELKSANDRSAKLEYQIEQLAQSLDEVKSLKQDALKRLSEEEGNVASLREVNNSMRQEADVIRKQSEDQRAYALSLEGTVKELQKKLTLKGAESQVSKECLKRLQLISDGGNNNKEKLNDVFKIIEVKSKLQISEKERLEIEAQLKGEKEEHATLKEYVNSIQQQKDQLQESHNKLEQERDNAKSQLSVLTQYYEEKQAHLRRELESQEELRQDAEGSAANISNSVQSYKIELQSCREQMNQLKEEFENQKQSYKMQLANEEKKFNETWVSARAAERRQEELRQENTQLRQKLSQMQKETDQSLLIKNSMKRGETNGSLPSPVLLENDFDGVHSPPASLPLEFDGSLPPIPPGMFSHMSMFQRPPHMHPGLPPPHPGLPPPPPGFLPPFMGPLHPPHHPHPDRRLPPAGRIASPPGFDRRSYSPGSDYSDHRYSPVPRYSPGGGNRNRSPDRRSDRSRHSNLNMRRKDQPSPDRWYTRSPQGFKQRQSPHRYYNNDDPLDDNKRTNAYSGKKTSTPLGPNDR